jgi:hypothetical protein
MRAPRLVATWIVGLAALAGAGCNDFHYYDITVSFNINQSTGGYPQAEVASVQTLLFGVSGADSGSFRIGPNANGLPLVAGATNLGTVEYATFADSGTLTFKVEAFNNSRTTPDCKTGEGTKAVMATSASTTMDAVIINKTGAGCTN